MTARTVNPPALTVVEVPAGAFSRLIADYLQERRAEGASRKTIAIYQDALEGVLLPFCAAVGDITEVGQVTSRVLNDLVVGLLDGTASRSGRPLSKATVSSYMRAVNTFLAWAAKDGGVAVDARAKLPRERKRVLDTLTREELQAMEDAAATERDKLIIRVLGDTGMRLNELLGLTDADFRVEGGKHFIKVRGKGDRERLVPIKFALARRLERYAKRPREQSPSRRLFLSHRRSRTTGEYEPLTSSGVEQLIRDLAVGAGITKRVYPHLFRHSFVTDYLRKGGSAILCAQVVGHESLAMINTVYQHLVLGDAHADLMRVLSADE